MEVIKSPIKCEVIGSVIMIRSPSLYITCWTVNIRGEEISIISHGAKFTVWSVRTFYKITSLMLIFIITNYFSDVVNIQVIAYD